MKKVTTVLSLIILFSSLLSYSSVIGADNSQTILAKANECIDAVKNGDSSKASQIQNPFKKDKVYLTCKGRGIERLYQVLLDLLFSEVDADVEKYIASLSSKKGDAEVIKEVSDKFSLDSGGSNSFANRYNSICLNKIVNYSIKYKDTYTDKKIDITTNYINGYFGGSNGEKCINLYKIKLNAYQSVANSKLKRNVINTYAADKKKFMTKIKDSWEKLLTSFDRYIAKFGIIKDQWPEATKKAQQ